MKDMNHLVNFGLIDQRLRRCDLARFVIVEEEEKAGNVK